MSKRKSKWEVVQCRLNREMVYKINADWRLVNKQERGIYLAALGVFLPIFQPQLRKVLTTLGVTAAVSGTRKKMKLLWTAYAIASCVHIPIKQLVQMD
jgi:hypothetical protein